MKRLWEMSFKTGSVMMSEVWWWTSAQAGRRRTQYISVTDNAETAVRDVNVIRA